MWWCLIVYIPEHICIIIRYSQRFVLFRSIIHCFMFHLCLSLICCALLSDNYILSLTYCLWPCSCPEDENNKLPALLPEMSGGGVDRQAPQSPHCGRRGRRLHTGAPQHWPHQEWKSKNRGRYLLWLTCFSLSTMIAQFCVKLRKYKKMKTLNFC